MNLARLPTHVRLPGVPWPARRLARHANGEALRLTVLTGTAFAFARFRLSPSSTGRTISIRTCRKIYQVGDNSTSLPPSRAILISSPKGGIKQVNITRAHLEEDVGKNFHFDRTSGVDFNRAGVPLLEIVSEPEITGPEMAYEYLNALKDVLIYGGVSDADMEKGMVRCDVNISVRPVGTQPLGKKIEIKNMNSFSGVRRALEHEIPRQIAVLQAGGQLTQETRRWDDEGSITEPMRSKEMAHDYRYFPEPDLMPFEPTAAWLAEVSQRVVELPLAKKQQIDARLSVARNGCVQTFVLGSSAQEIIFEAVARISAKSTRCRRQLGSLTICARN